MKHEITTKDLGALNELMLAEQWASTKFKNLYEMAEDKQIKNMFASICLEHGDRFDTMFEYLNSNKGGK